MGAVCDKICNGEMLSSMKPKRNTKNNKNQSLIQYQIMKELKRTSGQHFDSYYDVFDNEDEERVARSKENIRNRYNFDEESIGEGGFGTVARGTLKSDKNRVFAIKTISKEGNVSDLTLFLKEIEMLKVLDHPNLVKFYEVYEDKYSYHLVIEHLSGGELQEYWEEKEGFSEEETKSFLWQILLAVNYLHCRKIAHRDIKPENFLFTNQKREKIKLIDFGLSQTYQNRKLKTIAGSPMYLSPQVLDQTYTEKCDVWSAGVMMYQFVTGIMPFDGQNNNSIFDQIYRGHLNFIPVKNSKISEDGQDLLNKMLEYDEESRISADEALNHPWFQPKLDQVVSLGKQCLTKDMLSNLTAFSISSVFQREMIGLMVQTFDEEEMVERIYNAFLYFDKDFSGTIQAEEIADMYRNLGYEMNNSTIENIVDSLYLKEKGIITFMEFVAGTLGYSYFADEERLKVLFEFLDADNSGYIGFADINMCFRRFGRNLSRSRINNMIRECDINGDNEISFDEFKDLLCKRPNRRLESFN